MPAAGLVNIGFAFKSYDDVWKAVDGALGQYVAGQIAKVGLVSVTPLWNNGFRQVTSSTREIVAPADLKGFKMRVPPAPILTSLFQALGASPTPINFNELYSALQTKIVEGQENPLAIIATTKLYEVQKSLSMTSHVWDGYQILGNRRAWEKLPQDLKDIVQRELATSGQQEREDVVKLSDSLRQDLTAKGMVFHDVDRTKFQELLKTTSYYKDWKTKFGEEAWKVLEATAGSSDLMAAVATAAGPCTSRSFPFDRRTRASADDGGIRGRAGRGRDRHPADGCRVALRLRPSARLERRARLAAVPVARHGGSRHRAVAAGRTCGSPP